MVEFRGGMQMLVAEPTNKSSSFKLAHFFEYAHNYAQNNDGVNYVQVWMPHTSIINNNSPWKKILNDGWIKSKATSNPSLLILSSASDWKLAQYLYPKWKTIPKIHLINENNIRSLGHGAQQNPAIRIAVGNSVGLSMQNTKNLREEIQIIPLGIDPEEIELIASTQHNQRTQEVLILASRNPALGLAIRQKLGESGISCMIEIQEWTYEKWIKAMKNCAVVVILASKWLENAIEIQHLAAMATQKPLICNKTIYFKENICINHKNCLICDENADTMAKTIIELVNNKGERKIHELIDGGLATLIRHRRAKEKLNFQSILANIEELWQAACRAHKNK